MKITSETLEQAIVFATEKHKNVKRKGDGRPYILHPMSVLLTLLAIKESKNMFLLATAAILHDVVEDCDVTLQEIAELFGHNVAAIVDELTSDKAAIEKMGKTEYLTQKMIDMSSYSLCIKLVDRLDNVKDMKTMSNSFKLTQITSTEKILDTIEKERKLTKTHTKIISMIKKEIKKISNSLIEKVKNK